MVDETERREVWTRWAVTAGGGDAADAADVREVRLALVGSSEGVGDANEDAAAEVAGGVTEAAELAAAEAVSETVHSMVEAVITEMATEASVEGVQRTLVEAVAAAAAREAMLALGYGVAGAAGAQSAPRARPSKRVRFAAALVSEIRAIPARGGRMGDAGAVEGGASGWHGDANCGTNGGEAGGSGGGGGHDSTGAGERGHAAGTTHGPRGLRPAPTTWTVEAGGATKAKCRKCKRAFQPSEQRLRMYQAASTRGTAYALHRWHVTCVGQRLAGHVDTSDARVYQQLRAAQEEERQRQREEAATAARADGRAGIRMFLRPGSAGDALSR